MGAAAVGLERDGRAFGLAEVGGDVDVPFGVGGGAGEEVGPALVEEGVVLADGEAFCGFFALVTLDLCGRRFCLLLEMDRRKGGNFRVQTHRSRYSQIRSDQ